MSEVVACGARGTWRGVMWHSAGSRSSFLALQLRQDATTFSHVCAPPRDRGTTWSRFSAFEPQYWLPDGPPLLQSYKGMLHGTAAAYNGIPAQTGTSNGQSVSTMGGPEKLASVLDGTSNTLMMAEKFVDPTRYRPVQSNLDPVEHTWGSLGFTDGGYWGGFTSWGVTSCSMGGPIRDQRYEQAKRSVDFIQRYIFPGGALPSLQVLLENVGRDTDLNLHHMEDFGLHYARTLHLWHDNLRRARHSLEQRGYDEHFYRLWEFYLCYCEGGFLERSIGAAQLLLAKPGARPEPLLARGF